MMEEEARITGYVHYNAFKSRLDIGDMKPEDYMKYYINYVIPYDKTLLTLLEYLECVFKYYINMAIGNKSAFNYAQLALGDIDSELTTLTTLCDIPRDSAPIENWYLDLFTLLVSEVQFDKDNLNKMYTDLIVHYINYVSNELGEYIIARLDNTTNGFILKLNAGKLLTTNVSAYNQIPFTMDEQARLDKFLSVLLLYWVAEYFRLIPKEAILNNGYLYR